MSMFKPIKELIRSLETEFDQISPERKEVLERIAAYISEAITSKGEAKLTYICIHNSRRSHFGQVAGAVSAVHNALPVKTYSGGTIATAFNPNAVAALNSLGFKTQITREGSNPNYRVYFDENSFSHCFSKIFDSPENPDKNFAAIMTCGEAEENCPFVPNAEFKAVTTYEDPSSADGTGNENTVYTSRFIQILRDNLYLFSCVRK